MKKISSLFKRDYEGRGSGKGYVYNEVVEGSEWVINGEGIATEKFDGTCCMIQDGKLFKRYDAKHGKQPPEGFMPAQDPDPKTGHWPGWLAVDTNNPADKWHIEGWEGRDDRTDGTYELCGPKVQGNPLNLSKHKLLPHGGVILDGFPRDFDGIREKLQFLTIEGIVWHHPDGRMVKIKKKDFLYENSATPITS